MRRWLSVLAGVALVALTGTALALTTSSSNVVEKERADTNSQVRTAETKELSSEPVAAKEVDDQEPSWEEDTRKWEDPEVPPDLAVDDIPPQLEVLHPEDSAVFEVKEVVIEGVTEPGAKLSVGERGIEVSKSGAWRVVLSLKPGANKMKFTAKDGSGNVSSVTVTLFYEVPKEQPKEQPKPDKPREEAPKEEPKDQPPKDEEKEWEFTAHQVFGECSETPPYDVFHGTGKPGSVIHVRSEYGSGDAEIGDHGGWELKVIFETAPVGKAFPVKVKDEFGNHKVFEFIHSG